MSGFMVTGSNGVVLVNENTTMDPLDNGFVLDGPDGSVQFVALDPALLYRLAAVAMTAAHDMANATGRVWPGEGPPDRGMRAPR